MALFCYAMRHAVASRRFSLFAAFISIAAAFTTPFSRARTPLPRRHFAVAIADFRRLYRRFISFHAAAAMLFSLIHFYAADYAMAAAAAAAAIYAADA